MAVHGHIRWLFRSRQTERLNATGFWLLGIVLTIPLYFATGAMLQFAASALDNSDETDWITSRNPRALNLATRSLDQPRQPSGKTGQTRRNFQDQRDTLIEKLLAGDIGADSRLRSANEFDKTVHECGKASHLFARPELPVYTGCVSYTKVLAANGPDEAERQNKDSSDAPSQPAAKAKKTEKTAVELTSEERLVFRRFAKFVTTAFEPPEDEDGAKHTERRLAQALGLHNDTKDAESLDVPWIYVASKAGAIAVFPGTDVIAKHYDPASRPWYMATFNAKTELASPVDRRSDGSSDRISVTYLDVFSETPILVRTYLAKFKFNGQEFVVGIDLRRRGGSLGAGIGTRSTNLGWVAMAGALLLSFAALFILRSMTCVRIRCFAFVRQKNPVYGIVETTEKHQNAQESERSKSMSVTAGGGTHVKAEFGQTQSKTDKSVWETVAQVVRPLRRGQEYWDVTYNRHTSWHLFGIRFESIRRAKLGKIHLVYTNEILPEVNWEPFSPGPFSETDAERHEQRLLEILRRNADGSENGKLEVPFDADASLPLGLPKVPEWVSQAVKNPQELMAFRQRRAYVSLNSATLQDMYSNADFVRAVVLQSYFERILERGQADFLLRGKVVHRLISFPDPHARLALTDTSRVAYRAFLEAAVTRPRVLRRVDSPMIIEGALVPVYDFALINDSHGERVFVAHEVSEISVIDIATPDRSTQTYRVDGYLSWRTPDVRFYEDLYDRLARQSKEIRLSDGGI